MFFSKRRRRLETTLFLLASPTNSFGRGCDGLTTITTATTTTKARPTTVYKIRPSVLRYLSTTTTTTTIRDVGDGRRSVVALRGGVGVARDGAPFEKSDDDDDDDDELGVTIALFSAYFAVMGAKCALPSTMYLLDFTDGVLDLPRLLTASTLAVAVGKFASGPVVDKCGGIAALRVSTAALGACLAAIARTDSPAVFFRAWLVVDVLFSSCWAACLHAVRERFPESRWAGKIGVLASAARSGNAAAFALFSVLLGRGRGLGGGGGGGAGGGAAALASGGRWRIVYAAAAVAQLIPLLFLCACGGRRRSTTTTSTDDDNDVSFSDSLTVLASLAAARPPLFWLHLVSRSALMVFGSFLLFVPAYAGLCHGATPPRAARVGSVFAAGCLAAVAVGPPRYGRLDRRDRARFSVAACSASALCAASQWAHATSFSLPLIKQLPLSVVMFVWGLSFAVPFYLPPSLYALEKGGAAASATVADAFDVVGFGALALFNGYVAKTIGVATTEGGAGARAANCWSRTFAILTGCAAASAVCLGMVGRWEQVEDGEEKMKKQ